jgi:penicillin-binding protein 2B
LNLEKSDNSNDLSTYITDSYVNKDVDVVLEKLEELRLKPIILGEGKRVISQSSKIGDTLLEGDRIILKTNSLNITMPNIINWSRKDVEHLCILTGITCNYDGFGYVTSQSIKTGTVIEENAILEVKLEYKV